MISIVLGGGYIVLLFIIFRGLIKARQMRMICHTPTVTIVVVARNEETVIGRLLDSMEVLDYPEDRYEVMLIDDDSKDDTGKIMRKYSDRHKHWKTIKHQKADNILRGKKGGLTLGIRESTGEILLITDADCVVKPGWIRSMVSCFTPDIGMVLGNSPVRKRNDFLSVYQRFDNLCEASLAAATTAYNKPSHSNARNLAFRRIVFTEVGGYGSIAHVATGDDFFLSQLIRTTTKWKFAYNTDPGSFVETDEPTWGKRYWHQQLRRNSKAFQLTPLFFMSGAWVFLFHVYLAYLLFNPSQWSFLFVLLILKFTIEFISVYTGARLFRQKDIVKYFPLLWIIYPTVFIGTQLLGSLQFYRWK